MRFCSTGIPSFCKRFMAEKWIKQLILKDSHMDCQRKGMVCAVSTSILIRGAQRSETTVARGIHYGIVDVAQKLGDKGTENWKALISSYFCKSDTWNCRVTDHWCGHVKGFCMENGILIIQPPDTILRWVLKVRVRWGYDIFPVSCSQAATSMRKSLRLRWVVLSTADWDHPSVWGRARIVIFWLAWVI